MFLNSINIIQNLFHMKNLYLVCLYMFTLTASAQHQCQEDCVEEVSKKIINYNDDSQGTYSGCLNSFGLESGYGELNHSSFFYKGCWKNGKEHDSDGIEVQLNPNGTWKTEYKGGFLDGMRHGYGELRVISNNRKWMGEFYKGTQTERGYWYDENYYNPDDIIFTHNSDNAIIKIDKHPNKLTHHIDVKFGDIVEKFKFDTGADEIVFSEELFYKLKNQNIQFTDTGVEKKFRDAENSLITAKVFIIDLSISNIQIKNVRVCVGENLRSLFGNNILKKFSQYTTCINSKTGGECTVYK